MPSFLLQLPSALEKGLLVRPALVSMSVLPVPSKHTHVTAEATYLPARRQIPAAAKTRDLRPRLMKTNETEGTIIRLQHSQGPVIVMSTVSLRVRILFGGAVVLGPSRVKFAYRMRAVGA